MTTSGTATFNLDIADLVEEAFERCGAELRTGYDLRTARRSLNLLTVEWANRGINLWTIDQGSVTLIPGQSTYDIPADTIDLMDMVIRTGTGQNQTDINISRIAEPTYATIPNKNVQGRPIQVWIQRLRDNPKITIWPTPDQSQPYTFAYWRLRRIQDAGNSGTQTMDIPFRFLNCMVAGLAYYLSMKIVSVDPGRRAELKMDYEQQLDMASSEDREKAPIRFVPRVSY
jgi:hypothetical protein